jgi:hypothetical protein
MQTIQTTKGPNESAYIIETVFEERLDDLCPDKAVGSGDKNTVGRRNDVL